MNKIRGVSHRRKQRFLVCSFILSLLFTVSVHQSFANDGSEVDAATVQKEALALRQDMETLFAGEGSGALQRYWRQRAERGVNLRPLRELILRESEGQAQAIPVRVHPESARAVEFANAQMKLSGIDFYYFQPVFDETAPKPDLPEPDQQASYNRWKRARSIAVPLIGFAATLAEAVLANHGGQTQSLLVLTPSLMRAFAVAGLELQFSLFSNKWKKLWNHDEPALGFEVPLLSHSEQSYFRGKLNGLITLLNRTLGATRFITRSHVYSYIVNWGCTLVLYTAGFVTQQLLGLPGPSFNLVRLITNTWLLNTAFYFAFGLSQIGLAKFDSRREISELQRFQIETIAVKWNSFWRMVSLVPGLKSVGVGMQLIFGGLISVPLLAKLGGTNAFARETARQFARNEGATVEQGSFCERALSKAAGVLQFNRKASLWNVLTSVKNNVLTALGLRRQAA